MSELDKINALSERIEKMQKQAAKSTKFTAIGYLLVILFVFGYTTFIMSWIKQEVSADKLSASMRIMIEGNILTDENREAMVKYCGEQAPIWAEDLVQMTHHQLIPTMKLKVKHLVDKKSDEAIVILKSILKHSDQALRRPEPVHQADLKSGNFDNLLYGVFFSHFLRVHVAGYHQHFRTNRF